jgi:putative PIN family toxin of toxin-antitoxin system
MVAVFDCLVFLQAVISDSGPPLACLELAETRQIVLHVRRVILGEVRDVDVLSRPKIQAGVLYLRPSLSDLFLQTIDQLLMLTDNVPEVGFSIRDANDLPYLNLAIAPRANFLVRWDNDLLDLRNDPTFVSRFPWLRIVDPVTFLSNQGALPGIMPRNTMLLITMTRGNDGDWSCQSQVVPRSCLSTFTCLLRPLPFPLCRIRRLGPPWCRRSRSRFAWPFGCARG